MSFSGTVKEELAMQISSARHCQLAELAALIHFCGSTCEGGTHLCLETENEAVARKCFTLLKKTFNIDNVVIKGKSRMLPDDATESKVIQALHLRGQEKISDAVKAPASSLLIKNSVVQEHI